MAEIEWTEEAKYWLQQIYDYISRDNEEAAWQVILGIYDRVQILRQFPESGHRYEKYPDRHIRILLYGHYRVAYLIRDIRTAHALINAGCTSQIWICRADKFQVQSVRIFYEDITDGVSTRRAPHPWRARGRRWT